jgi:hypothetical protein
LLGLRLFDAFAKTHQGAMDVLDQDRQIVDRDTVVADMR